jgi:hypothetical protein
MVILVYAGRASTVSVLLRGVWDEDRFFMEKKEMLARRKKNCPAGKIGAAARKKPPPVPCRRF